MALHLAVDVVELVHVLVVGAPLLLIVCHLTHFTLPVLGVGLGESDIARPANVCTLLDGILAEDVEISLLLELVPVGRYVLLIGDDSDALASVECLVGYLNLEGKCFDFG